MESYGTFYSSQSHAPSAPSLPASYADSYSTTTSLPSSYHHRPPGYAYPQPSPPSYGHYSFPPGTHPDVIRSFEMVDRDRSGFIDDKELQQALSSGYQRFSLRTVKLLIFLFKDPRESSLRIGPKEFAALWSCLGEWRGIFQRYDSDRSGKIDLFELRDALYGIGYAIPPSVLQFFMSKYESGNGRKTELSFDSFVEIGIIVKGLTEKFKKEDSRYTGSATLTYDSFMSMVIPFIVQYD
ncbi:probable calcium-binding protein CML48 [Mangifera indica]|uniref:probable calcium-binding protein CML48 n=1 Tax=Mangifera indica TaxID=29780 RepID=UPI001CFC0A06|nr:probable calcium-binding protein CML48 [Mangifera indica]